MATKTFNEICVEYAHQLGKGLPLTAPEMCNALVMYLNQQVVDMQNMVQTALNAVKSVQDDLAEGEYATLGANNTFRGNNSFLQSVQADGGITINGENVATENDTDEVKIPSDDYDEFLFNNPNNKTNIARFYCNTTESIYIAIDTANHVGYIKYQEENGNINNYKLPNKGGIMALTSDVPDLDNYTGTVHIVQGTAGRGVAVHDTANTSPYTKYGYGKIETYGNSNTLQYTLNIPNKNGTIATLDDISSSPSSDKYFTRVIYHTTDEDTQYIIFSCMTDTDLSANTSYQDVIDLLNNLGATSNETALPCNGKMVSGGILVGVYTDGTNIIVFDTDNTLEELTMSSEIKFVSK